MNTDKTTMRDKRICQINTDISLISLYSYGYIPVNTAKETNDAARVAPANESIMIESFLKQIVPEVPMTRGSINTGSFIFKA